MANMLAGGMVALGVDMETEGRDSAKMRKSYDAVKELRPRTELQPKYHPRLIGEGPRVLDDAKVDILDFPIRFASRTVKESKHLIDIIREHEGDFDIEAIKTLMDANNYAALPAPLCPKQATQRASKCVLPRRKACTQHTATAHDKTLVSPLSFSFYFRSVR